MPLYAPPAVERAMKIQQVILRAMSGEINWMQAAHIVGLSPRSMSRWKWRFEQYGYDGLLDRRRGRPSPKRAPFAEVQRVLHLYRERFHGFNARHFHQIVCREEGVTLSYTFVKKALQEAGLVPKRKARGRHHFRRERRPCFGEMIHLDGSPHPWLALVPEERQIMLAILDDATSTLFYAQLWPAETTEAVLTGLWEVVERFGIPMAAYTDRAGWAFHTPKAGGKVNLKNLTQVGTALAKLGIEHIPAYSPQARGRSERLNRTLQDRLVNEMRMKGITAMAAANAYLRDRFVPQFNRDFTCPPRDPASAFVSAAGTDLAQVFCFEELRTVARDNTARFGSVFLQLQRQPGRVSCAGLTVLVRRHLDAHHSVWQGQRLLGLFDAKGKALPLPSTKTQNRSLHLSKQPVILTC